MFPLSAPSDRTGPGTDFYSRAAAANPCEGSWVELGQMVGTRRKCMFELTHKMKLYCIMVKPDPSFSILKTINCMKAIGGSVLCHSPRTEGITAIFEKPRNTFVYMFLDTICKSSHLNFHKSFSP